MTMKTWKLVAGIASMVVAALVLTSVITSYRDYGGTSVQPLGLIALAIAAVLLGLAGIVQIVFRDGQVPQANKVVAGLYAAAFIFFIITAIRGTFDAAGWIQLIAFMLWSAGCTVFTYLESTWASEKAEKAPAASDGDATSEDPQGEAVVEVGEAEASSESSDLVEAADLPPLPDVGDSPEFASNPPPRPHEVADGALWDDPTTAPPRI